MRLSSARSAFFKPKARAISRVSTLPGCEPMKARRSALEGSAGVLRLEDFAKEDIRALSAIRSDKPKERLWGLPEAYSAASDLPFAFANFGFALALFFLVSASAAVRLVGALRAGARRPLGTSPRAARASIKATASSSVRASGVFSRGRVALTPL